MVKYFFKRFFRGCISVIIAIALIMMMVFSWLDATLIFAEDEQYVKLSNNQRTLYMYQKWEEYDYLDYVPYTDWLNQLVSAGELSEEEWNAIPADSPDVTSEDREVLQQALASLGDEERQVVLLHAVTGLKHREIAALLEMPLATVLSKYHRALKKLRVQLEGDDAL